MIILVDLSKEKRIAMLRYYNKGGWVVDGDIGKLFDPDTGVWSTDGQPLNLQCSRERLETELPRVLDNLFLTATVYEDDFDPDSKPPVAAGSPSYYARRQNNVGRKMNDILNRARLTEDQRLALAALCDGPCSAEGLADLLDLKHMIRANNLVGSAGHKIFDAAPESSVVRAWHPKGLEAGWYHVVAPGRRSKVDKKFYWDIRSQVRKAFIELGWYAPHDVRAPKKGAIEPRLEGAEVLRLLSIRERDPVLRGACLAVHGCRCKICGNDLGEIYGELGKGFIHVHHRRGLAGRKGSAVTDPAKDLIPVCPNCHSIIHRGGCTRSPDEVRRYLRRPA